MLALIAAMSAGDADQAHEIESTYKGDGFRVDLTGLEKAGAGGGPDSLDNPLVGLEAGTRLGRDEVA